MRVALFLAGIAVGAVLMRVLDTLPVFWPDWRQKMFWRHQCRRQGHESCYERLAGDP